MAKWSRDEAKVLNGRKAWRLRAEGRRGEGREGGGGADATSRLSSAVRLRGFEIGRAHV